MTTRKTKSTSERRRPIARSRGAFVLILVLIVVVVLALAAYTYSELMVSYRTATRLTGQQLQARALADSGIDMARIFLDQPRISRVGASGGGVYDNAQQFRGIVVLADDDPEQRGNFSILAPAMGDDQNYGGVRYGFEDESARLNLNALLVADKMGADMGRNLLKGLPGMTDEIADKILDWLDPDDEPREFGAESSYYLALTPSYTPANGPFTTIEELLLVGGVTPELLFGLDANRNGMIDPQEQGGATSGGGDQSAELGWAAYLTLHSKEANQNGDGEPRISINQDDLEGLFEQISQRMGEDWATFIVLYRQNGPAAANQNARTSPLSNAQIDFNKPGSRKFTQVLELVGAKVQVTQQGSATPVLFASPITEDIPSMAAGLPLMMDNLSAGNSSYIPGRININQAPKLVLQGVPGMSEEILTELLSRRRAEPDENQPNRNYETWLLAEGICTLQEMKILEPFLCAGGDVYRGRIVGYFQGGQAACRVEAIFDASESPTRLLLWRDLSHLGRGYALETLGVDLAEAGGAP